MSNKYVRHGQQASKKAQVPEKARGILLKLSRLERRVLPVNKGTESDNDRLLATKEIATILKVTLNTVKNRKWRKRNGCPLFRIGRRTYALETRFWKWVNEKGMINNGNAN